MINTKEILERHNKLVKQDYISTEIYDFETWLILNANFEENYIEIPSNETLSGHAEILEF